MGRSQSSTATPAKRQRRDPRDVAQQRVDVLERTIARKLAQRDKLEQERRVIVSELQQLQRELEYARQHPALQSSNVVAESEA